MEEQGIYLVFLENECHMLGGFVHKSGTSDVLLLTDVNQMSNPQRSVYHFI